MAYSVAIAMAHREHALFMVKVHYYRHTRIRPTTTQNLSIHFGKQ